MFFSYAEKCSDGFFGEWQMRQVAFDSIRRYFYYSQPTKDVAPVHGEMQNSQSVAPSMTDNSLLGLASSSLSNTNGSTTTRSSRGAAVTAVGVTEVTMSPRHLHWKRKLKLLSVTPLATRRRLNLSNPSLQERQLYELEIVGEARPLLSDETPPAGPLICPAADLSPLEQQRCTADNDDYIQDPFFLKEIFDALRDQFEELERMRVQALTASGDAASASASPAATQTLSSPRRAGEGVSRPRGAPVRLVFRMRNEREFRRLWYLLQMVLGYDKLIVRPYRGLPPYDPRNGVAFGHIPMTVWHTFESLDKAVFYTFIRGDVYGLDESAALTVTLAGVYLCITHDSVLLMRHTGKIPRWLLLSDVQEFHWNLMADTPFFCFLSDPPIPDLIFVPRPPVYGPDSISSYDPRCDVRRVAKVIHDTCFASLSIRRVIRLREVVDGTVAAYADRLRSTQRGLHLHPNDGHNRRLSCPLPKEQLAAVWQQVQSELLERGNMANQAAIPIYATTAREVELSEDQLSTVERELDGERERRDDIVGMPLDRVRQLVRQTGGSDSHTHHRRSTRYSPRHLQESQLTNGTTELQVAPLTMELLQTPQLQGRFAHREGTHSATSPDQQNDSGHDISTSEASEFSSYLVPGTRYITHEELLEKESSFSVTKLQSSTSLLHMPSPSSQNPTSSPPPTTAAHQNREERTVNEIVRRSIVAMGGKKQEQKAHFDGSGNGTTSHI